MASFCLAKLNMKALNTTVTSLASTLTASRTEMTGLRKVSKTVRTDLVRETKNTPDHHGTWKRYGPDLNATLHLNKFWTWSLSTGGEFVEVDDRSRCSLCYRATKTLHPCKNCKAFVLCSGCLTKASKWKHRTTFYEKESECDRFQKTITDGKLVRRELPSLSMAIKNQVFGEGAERIVRKARFTNASGQFIGPKYVAKDSRFVEGT